jgi:iron complex transport system permease protein
MTRTLAIALAGLLLAIFGALCIGRYPIGIATIAGSFGPGHPDTDPVAVALIWDTRLPRICAAMLVGAGLSTAGACFQGMFRNPLVAPDLLGVLAGSGVGAAAAILLGLGGPLRMALTCVGGVAAVALAILIARAFGQRGDSDDGPLLLVFGGIVAGALFTALLSLAKYVADPDNALPDIVYWLLGSLAQVDRASLAMVAAPLLIGIAVLIASGRLLDLMVLSDDEAMSLGLPIVPVRLLLIGVATAVCAITVSIAGTIGWVGLVIPHIARLMVGPAHARLMPLAAVVGAGFLLIADTLARTATASEIPIGIITNLIGVIAFLGVLPRVGRSWR